MPRRNRSTRRRPNRRSGLPTPGNFRRVLYTGTVTAGGTIALSLTTIAGLNTYRVLSITAEIVAEKPTFVQLAIRGSINGETETSYSPVNPIGVIPKRITVRQPKQNGFWQPNSTAEHVGWVRNGGTADILYNIIARITEKSELNLKGFSALEEVVEVLPSSS